MRIGRPVVGYIEELTNTPIHNGKDYTGEKINEWTVLGFHNVKKGKSIHYYWKCRCSCGHEYIIDKHILISGKTKTCRRCYFSKTKGIVAANWKGFGDIPSTILYRIKQSLIRRSKIIEFDIDCEYLDSLWKQQNKKCVYSGRALTMSDDASVDRIDSNKGYIKGNVQWVHKDINRVKWILSPEKFINLCTEVATNSNADEVQRMIDKGKAN